MKTVGDIIKLSSEYLQKHGVVSHRRSAEMLLAHILKMERMDLYMEFDKPVEENELGIMRKFLSRNAEGEPLEYIIGKIKFFGCDIKTDKRALIPRQESEILLSHIEKRIDGKGVLWDICCGSGCLGLGLKKRFPELTVVLSDLSEEALSLAKENAKLNELDVEFRHGDLLAPFEGEKADFVVCNPPYVFEEEYDALEKSVKNFEPKEALIGGLDYYKRLERDLPKHLNPDAKLFFEIGVDVSDIFHLSYWKNKSCEKDWSGRDRFFFCEC